MTNKPREEIRLCFCGGLQVGEELREEDGYYFLTDKGQDVFLERLSLKGLARVPDEFEVTEVSKTYKDFGGNDSIWEEAQQALLKAIESQIGRL